MDDTNQVNQTTLPPIDNTQPPVIPPASQPIAQVGEGVGDKERVDAFLPSEKIPVVELKEEEKIPEEVEGWIEKLGHEHVINIPQPVSPEEETLLSNAHAQITDDAIVLPVTAEELQQGLHEKIWSSARWLAEWCVKIVKIFGNRVKYRVQ